jgi:hypothetical protein
MIMPITKSEGHFTPKKFLTEIHAGIAFMKEARPSPMPDRVLLKKENIIPDVILSRTFKDKMEAIAVKTILSVFEAGVLLLIDSSSFFTKSATRKIEPIAAMVITSTAGNTLVHGESLKESKASPMSVKGLLCSSEANSTPSFESSQTSAIVGRTTQMASAGINRILTAAVQNCVHHFFSLSQFSFLASIFSIILLLPYTDFHSMFLLGA